MTENEKTLGDMFLDTFGQANQTVETAVQAVADEAIRRHYASLPKPDAVEGCRICRVHANEEERQRIIADYFASLPPGDEGIVEAYNRGIEGLERQRDEARAERDCWRKRAESWAGEIETLKNAAQQSWEVWKRERTSTMEEPSDA